MGFCSCFASSFVIISESHEGRIESFFREPQDVATPRRESHEGRIESSSLPYGTVRCARSESHEGRIESCKSVRR